MRSKELLEYYLEKGIDAVNEIIYSNETRIAIVNYLLNKGKHSYYGVSSNQELYKNCNIGKISQNSFLKHIKILKYHNLIQCAKVSTNKSLELSISPTKFLIEIETREKRKMTERNTRETKQTNPGHCNGCGCKVEDYEEHAKFCLPCYDEK